MRQADPKTTTTADDAARIRACREIAVEKLIEALDALHAPAEDREDDDERRSR